MEISNLIIYAGKLLDQRDELSIGSLQKYIANRKEVGKYLPVEEIEKALDLLVLAGFLDCAGCNWERKYTRSKSKEIPVVKPAIRYGQADWTNMIIEPPDLPDNVDEVMN